MEQLELDIKIEVPVNEAKNEPVKPKASRKKGAGHKASTEQENRTAIKPAEITNKGRMPLAPTEIEPAREEQIQQESGENVSDQALEKEQADIPQISSGEISTNPAPAAVKSSEPAGNSGKSGREGNIARKALPQTDSVYVLRDVIRQRWPEAAYPEQFDGRKRVKINLPELSALIPPEGIPYGQMIEITGGVCSGKTSVIMKALGAMSPSPRILYVDSTESFFPPAAAAAGINLQNLLILKNRNLEETLRTVELLLERKQVDCIVFDFVGIRTALPRILLHRLRQQVVRAQALVFFLTGDHIRLLPASLVSMQLTVTKVNRRIIEITTTRSRITNEGTKGRMNLEAA